MRVSTKARPAAVMAASAASLGVAAPSFAAQAAARTADRSGTPGGGTAVSRIAGLDYFTAAIAAATFQGGQTATPLLAHATWAAPPGAEAVVGASGTAEVSGGPSAVSRTTVTEIVEALHGHWPDRPNPSLAAAGDGAHEVRPRHATGPGTARRPGHPHN